MYIYEELSYGNRGDSVDIVAEIYFFGVSTLAIEWYYESDLIVNNFRYSLSADKRVLSIVGVDTDILGLYTVLVNVDGMNAMDGTQLMFTGKNGALEKGIWPFLRLNYWCSHMHSTYNIMAFDMFVLPRMKPWLHFKMWLCTNRTT